MISDESAARAINWTMAMALALAMTLGGAWIVAYESRAVMNIFQRLSTDEKRALTALTGGLGAVGWGVRWLGSLVLPLIRTGTAAGERGGAGR
jgi:hypothetical protein